VRKSLSDKGVAALKPRAQRYAYPDPELRGHYVRVQPSGAKSFAAVAREPAGKQIWTTVGSPDVIGIDEARELARTAILRIREGLPAVELKGETFGTVADNWIQRHVIRTELRSRPEIERLLDRHILPVWKNREFISLRRSDVASLLDHVEDNHGARQADYCLNIARSIMNWFATRNDDYNPPIVRGMRRQSPAAQARGRILSDSEICSIWKLADAPTEPTLQGRFESTGTFGAIIRVALLTAQRRAKVVSMKWADLSDDGEWTIPKAPREKDNVGSVVLPETALAIIRVQPRMLDNPYIFAGRGKGCFNGFSKCKERLDAKLGPDVAPWTIHDLRRTARSLMSRAGISRDVSERIMGHKLQGIEGIYDRHSYAAEKADALQRLAALIDSIVNPRENVVPMAKRKKRG
jgi:integrase